MTQQEYENKKRECLQEFCKLHDCETPHDYIVETFNFAFDRAYALGQKKEPISQEEIENEAVDYAFGENKKRPDARPDTAPEYVCEDLIDAFKAGVNFALGKQEKDAEKRPALTDKEVYALESVISELESLMDGTLDEDYHKGQKSIINALKRIIKKYEKK